MKGFLCLFLLFAGAVTGQVRPHVIGKPANVARPAHNPPIIINNYTEAVSYDQCTNVITVSNSAAFNAGDTVLLIQMKGALIDTTNTASFGTILDYRAAGNFEFNYIRQKSGNRLTFKNKLTKEYDIPTGIVQLVRVPYFDTAFFADGLTCAAWDGSKGGILALVVSNGMTSLGSIDVGGLGFRGGEGYNSLLPASNCFNNSYNYPYTSQYASFKGESISGISQNINKGKGSPASGGGGGLSYNSGGGGGANAGAGGFGGYQSDACGTAVFDNRGLGGKNLFYPNIPNKIFMGSGGGAGHADNTDGYPTTPDGGAGGGIAIIITDTLWMAGKEIIATGNNGQYCYSMDCRDGRGGGGGGGTILLSTIQIPDTLTLRTEGGNGGFVNAAIVPGEKVGPGGGGGGGAFFYNMGALPPNVALINNGGVSGFLNSPGISWGATDGSAGLNFFNFNLPFDSVLFKPNIDSVRFTDSMMTCNKFSFFGNAFTNTDPINFYQWNFGDGNFGTGQAVTHNYTSQNSYAVTLTAIDINGCKDSISNLLNPRIIPVDAGPDKAFCSAGIISVSLSGSGNGQYAWSPAVYLNNSSSQNPIATIDTTTIFYLTLTNNGCIVRDSVKITVKISPILTLTKSNDINCTLPYAKITVTGAQQYSWNPQETLSNIISNSATANPTESKIYRVTGSNKNGCSATDSIKLIVDFSKGNFVLPNSFTPNGDGLNDCFGVKYYGNIQSLSFIIYNRYGQKVFETKNINECWDGNYKGQKADVGNYIYYINAKTFCGNINRSGNVLLIR